MSFGKVDFKEQAANEVTAFHVEVAEVQKEILVLNNNLGRIKDLIASGDQQKAEKISHGLKIALHLLKERGFVGAISTLEGVK